MDDKRQHDKMSPQYYTVFIVQYLILHSTFVIQTIVLQYNAFSQHIATKITDLKLSVLAILEKLMMYHDLINVNAVTYIREG